MHTKTNLLWYWASAVLEGATIAALLIAVVAVLFAGCGAKPNDVDPSLPDNPVGDFIICASNAQPVGQEDYPIANGWLYTATTDIGPISVKPWATEPGCWTIGKQQPKFELLDKINVTVHSAHPCFGEPAGWNETIVFVRGQPAYLTFSRNQIPCTADYELDCSRVDDALVVATARQYLGLTPSIEGCCDLYGETTDQEVCLVCGDFDLFNDDGSQRCKPESLKVHKNHCTCQEIEDDTEPPPIEPPPIDPPDADYRPTWDDLGACLQSWPAPTCCDAWYENYLCWADFADYCAQAYSLNGLNNPCEAP